MYDNAYELVADALGCDVHTLTVDSGFNRLPAWDSFGHVAIMNALEEEFDIAIDDDAIAQFETMGSIIDLFQRQIESRLK
jgi:acyl carrier protein